MHKSLYGGGGAAPSESRAQQTRLSLPHTDGRSAGGLTEEPQSVAASPFRLCERRSAPSAAVLDCLAARGATEGVKQKRLRVGRAPAVKRLEKTQVMNRSVIEVTVTARPADNVSFV